MRIAFFEDGGTSGFGPLTLTRPVFELLCGQFSLRERLIRLGGVTDWGAFLRPYLAEFYRERHPEARINDHDWLLQGPTLLVNGRWLADLETWGNIQPDQAGFVGDTPVYLTLEPDEAIVLAGKDWDGMLPCVARSRRPVVAGGRLLCHPWDLVDHNSRQLTLDFQALGCRQGQPLPAQVACLGPTEAIHVDPAVEIEPFVILDSRRGPITVAAGARLLAYSRLDGPCHIGEGTHILAGHVRGGTTIGPVCRIGGEVEASIFQGFANKTHTGFVGHSFVGEWVNLGALTTTSDLKSDYSPVQVPLHGGPVDTGLMKVGSFIGDFTKTAIGTLFNTGSSIGVMCLVLPAGEFAPRYMPSFTSLWHGTLSQGLSLDRNLSGVRIAMQRRGQDLSAANERLLRLLSHASKGEREGAIANARDKLMGKALRA